MAQTMRGAVLTAFGNPDAIEFRKDVPRPRPGNDEVLIRVKASSVTDTDKQIASGGLHSRFVTLPAILGVDVVGTVEEFGKEVQEFKVGDDVCGILAADRTGAFAEYVCVPQHQLVHRPSLVSEEDAAAVLTPGLRAYTALQYKMKTMAGDTVLVMNGASTNGNILIQLALSWGAKVITTASTSAEFNFLQGLSTQIDRVIDLSSENFVNAVYEETNSLGVDLLIHSEVARFGEPPSNATCSFDLSSIPKRDYIKCLAPHGMWVTSSEIQLDPPESRLLLLKSASISFLCDQTWLLAPSQSGRLLHILNDLLDKVSRGLVRVKIAQTFTLERVRQALKELDTQVGSILIKPQ